MFICWVKYNIVVLKCAEKKICLVRSRESAENQLRAPSISPQSESEEESDDASYDDELLIHTDAPQMLEEITAHILVGVDLELAIALIIGDSTVDAGAAELMLMVAASETEDLQVAVKR